MKRLILSLALVFPAVAAAQPYVQPYEKDNGIIRIRLNDRIAPLGEPSPMITGLCTHFSSLTSFNYNF